MLRDGTIYFGVMLASTSSVLLSFYLLSEYEQGITAILTNIISSTMISRLMLNIRDPKNRSSLRPEGTAAETRTGAVFTSIIQSSADGQSFASRQDTDTALPVHSRYSELDRHDFMNNSIELRIRTTSHT
ncbi:hypothetical protein JR316_0006079 [Psilocybe cubensis]|uniref:Uncharacterized protein n=2 Tax=Psilocybe cubensis TaxID=181762 RepID=A0ACB8H1J0_PSICU|nr:hypothetical protein JR316_0006079 [Psilocybe cubensis]KAH9481552.1 hypothetical protein JR316_0006079 [Psilocybe cubensis]